MILHPSIIYIIIHILLWDKIIFLWTQQIIYNIHLIDENK